MLDPRRLEPKLNAYSELHGLSLAAKLGSGTDGLVWQTKSDTAIKAAYYERQYRTELACYRRLKARNVDRICGLAVPRLVGWDDNLFIVEMTIVAKPWLLDFGKAYVDQQPDYPEDALLEAVPSSAI